MSCQFKNECPSYSGWCESPNLDFSRCIPFLVEAARARDARIKELEERPSPPPGPTVAYKCDRRACDKCVPECTHTTDIRHAENFEVNDTGVFQEVSL